MDAPACTSAWVQCTANLARFLLVLELDAQRCIMLCRYTPSYLGVLEAWEGFGNAVQV